MSDNFVDNIATLVKVASSFTERRQLLHANLQQSTTMPYNGGLFKVDVALLMFINFQISRGNTSSILLDYHLNPIVIGDLQQALDLFLDTYNKAVEAYQLGMVELKKLRTSAMVAQR